MKTHRANTKVALVSLISLHNNHLVMKELAFISSII
jgi:hypothetical protein